MDPITIIHDYNLGISIGINHILRNCSLKPLENNTFDSDANFTEVLLNQGLGFAVKIKSPESFLHLDSDYFYTGMGQAHSIYTDVFISNRTDKFGKDFTYSSIHEYQFLAVIKNAFNIDKLIKTKNYPFKIAIISRD